MYQRSIAAIAILLLVPVGLACSHIPGNRPLTWHLLLETDATAPDRDAVVRQTASVTERRLDALGVHNFTILPQGTPLNGRILVTLPEVADRERLKNVITARGRLELTAVVGPASPSPVQTFKTREDAVASLGGSVPANRRVLPYVEANESGTGQQTAIASGPQKWLVLQAPAIVDGGNLRNAVAFPSRTGALDYQISFSLTTSGAEKFGAWTGAHINDYIGIVLNDEVKSVAFIKSQMTDQGEISGRFTKQSAEDLALILRSGALPAPVKIIAVGEN